MPHVFFHSLGSSLGEHLALFMLENAFFGLLLRKLFSRPKLWQPDAYLLWGFGVHLQQLSVRKLPMIWNVAMT